MSGVVVILGQAIDIRQCSTNGALVCPDRLPHSRHNFERKLNVPVEILTSLRNVVTWVYVVFLGRAIDNVPLLMIAPQWQYVQSYDVLEKLWLEGMLSSVGSGNRQCPSCPTSEPTSSTYPYTYTLAVIIPKLEILGNITRIWNIGCMKIATENKLNSINILH